MIKFMVDLDGVLADFMSHAHKFHNLDYSYEDYPYPMAEWDCLPPESGRLTTEQFWDALDEDFWASTPWMPDGQEILDVIESYAGPKEICLLTAPTRSPGCAAGKMAWIRRELPKYRRQFLIGNSKQFCASKDTVLIDDADRNIDAFKAAGGLTVLVPRKWNSNYELDGFTVDVVDERIREIKEYFNERFNQ